jgi:predicted cupin superfamily sugar epimerase
VDSVAADLISGLGLTPHPEGGYYREIFRSAARVQPLDGRTDRLALTTIYFLLVAGQVSRWHRVASDEVWHYYEGGPLELFVADAGFHDVSRRLLGQVGDNREPVRVVIAGEWQAARSMGPYTLVGCTVGPGFEFADFEMLDSLPDEAASLKQRHPDLASFI